MAAFRVTVPASEDLFNIWPRVARHSVETADGVWDQIYKQFELLATFPEIGRIREEFSSELYLFPSFKPGWHSTYLIFYLIRKPRIDIIRVIESHLDITPDLFE